MTTVDLLVVGGCGFVGSGLVDTAVKAGLDVAYTYESISVSRQYWHASSWVKLTRVTGPVNVASCARTSLASRSLNKAIALPGLRHSRKVLLPTWNRFPPMSGRVNPVEVAAFHAETD